MNKKTVNYILGIYALLFIVLSYFTIQINANGDDWYPFSLPLWNLGLKDIFRPAEYIWVILAEEFPNSFPLLNHIIVLVCHLLNAIMLNVILKWFNIKETIRLILFGAFLFSPAVIAAVLSIDGTNQVISTTFCLLGFTMFYKYRNWCGVTGWILLTMYACMHKELAMTWYVGTPFLSYILDRKDSNFFEKKAIKNLLFMWVIGVIAVGAYLIIRVTFSLHHELGFTAAQDGNHALTLSPLNIFKNLVLISSTSVTTIDSVALLGTNRNYLLVFLTTILSLPFVVLLIKLMFKLASDKHKLLIILSLLFITITVISPHLLMDHCGEIHTYSFLLPYIIIVAYLINDINWNTSILVILCMFVVGMIISSVDKINEFIKTGSYSTILQKEIQEKTIGNPSKIYVIRILPTERKPIYSVFCMPEETAYNKHIFNYALDNWNLSVTDNIAIRKNNFSDDVFAEYVKRYSSEYDCIYLIRGVNVEYYSLKN